MRVSLPNNQSPYDFASAKALVCDVDGVLTNGALWMASPGEWRRGFHIHDGLGIKQVIRAGLRVALISGSNTADIKDRAQKLGIETLHLGIEEKLPVFNQLLDEWQIDATQVIYMGDDLPDLPILECVGMPVTVPNAINEICENPRFYCTTKPGGSGAVREICDLILNAKKRNS